MITPTLLAPFDITTKSRVQRAIRSIYGQLCHDIWVAVSETAEELLTTACKRSCHPLHILLYGAEVADELTSLSEKALMCIASEKVDHMFVLRDDGNTLSSRALAITTPPWSLAGQPARFATRVLDLEHLTGKEPYFQPLKQCVAIIHQLNAYEAALERVLDQCRTIDALYFLANNYMAGMITAPQAAKQHAHVDATATAENLPNIILSTRLLHESLVK